MRLYVVDAFTSRRFSGNQAGVALLDAGEEFPGPELMQALAAELKHSETVFLRPQSADRFQLRYFTPAGEVDLCGHATIAAFTALREREGLEIGTYTAVTPAGALPIQVEREMVWMELAPPRVLRTLSDGEAEAIYRAYGLSLAHRPGDLPVQVVRAGLADVLLPVNSREALDGAVQNRDEVRRLSAQLDVVGVHMFWMDPVGPVRAHCRNFAPRYAIDEEAATGTSTGALTYYLHRLGKLHDGGQTQMMQGEAMGRPSELFSRLVQTEAGVKVFVGGRAVITLCARLL